MDNKQLAELISEFVQSTPVEIIQAVVNMLDEWDYKPDSLQQSIILANIQSPQAKSKLKILLDTWIKHCPHLPAQGLAMAMRSSMMTFETTPKQSLELVWTGPATQAPTRRTDQALLELIRSAKERLVIISFAVYKAQVIIDAIGNTLRRDVEVIICLEDAEESKGKVSFSGLHAFSDSIFRLASFYCWPIEKRNQTNDGKHGSLHAKVAVADRERAFISSANLTDYAMDLNIELGVLVEDSKLGENIDSLFSDLIIRGILEKIDFP